MNALIVDDEPFAIRGIIDRVDWKRLGFEFVLTANSYAQALNIFLHQDIDVLICDIEMPYGSGIDLATWVREHRPDALFVFLTSHGDFEYARQAVHLDCLEYILKPARTDELEDVLRRAAGILAQRRETRLYCEYGRQYLAQVRGPLAQEEEDAVDRVERYISAHIAEPLTVKQLAELVYVTPDHLTRLFKRKNGLPIVNYINQQRMQLARALLEDGKLSVSRVSAAVGFADYSYFIRMFKKAYGVTPKEYASGHREE